ncbi:MAG: hypothetical protein MK108_02555 [Mariniblastus sp.]|nr:hypothetical protein [Mariniblastus sp.]
MIEYRRLRAPGEDQQTLIDPPLGQASQRMAENRQAAPRQSLSIHGRSLLDLQEQGRHELLQLARDYTLSYRDVDLETGPTSPVILSGHQPNLFHPGVWFKNFVLSRLGQQLAATPVNLIVDNDIAKDPSIQAPRVNQTSVSLQDVPLDRPSHHIPYECRSITDLPFFQSFDQRTTQAISSLVDAPLVQRLWPLVCRQIPASGNNLGLAISQGRHQLEQQAGLNTLEVPLSQIAQTRTFAEFVLEIFQRIEEFHEAYNHCLLQYRAVHRIRSNAHPVPPLRQENGWLETPLWIWEADRPVRRQLYLQKSGNLFQLTDRSGWQISLDRSGFIDQFCQLGQHGVAIRPRALVTTMFSRLVLSDLFLHGIGGSKYDQLTDAIVSRFFLYEMPSYMTLTATALLPCREEQVMPADVGRLNVLARELRFHPEEYVDQTQPPVGELVALKQHWLNQVLPRGRRAARHQQIEYCNQQLRRYACPSEQEIAEEQTQLASRVERNRLLRSREYSFCLFPESLLEDLSKLAR